MAFGVLAYGAYIPRLRLSQRSIAESPAPGLISLEGPAAIVRIHRCVRTTAT